MRTGTAGAAGRGAAGAWLAGRSNQDAEVGWGGPLYHCLPVLPRSRRCSPSPATTQPAPSSSWDAAMAPSTMWVSSGLQMEGQLGQNHLATGEGQARHLEQTISPPPPRCAEVPSSDEGQ